MRIFTPFCNDKSSVQIIVYQLSQFLFSYLEIAEGLLNGEAEMVRLNLSFT